LFWLGIPAFADELVWHESFEGLKPPAEIVGVDEVGEMPPQPVVIAIMISLGAPPLSSGRWRAESGS
jgi:hypothetical protein